MADLFILALTVFTFQNNTKMAINIYLLEIFALFLVFSYQFTAKCLSLPPPLLGGAISKPLTLPFALAFRTSNIETVVKPWLNQSLHMLKPKQICLTVVTTERYPISFAICPNPKIWLKFALHNPKKVTLNLLEAEAE